MLLGNMVIEGQLHFKTLISRSFPGGSTFFRSIFQKVNCISGVSRGLQE